METSGQQYESVIADVTRELAAEVGVLAMDDDTLVFASWTMRRTSRRARILLVLILLFVAPMAFGAFDVVMRPGAPVWASAIIGLGMGLAAVPWMLIETRIVATTASPGIMRESFNALTHRKRRKTIVPWADVDGYDVVRRMEDDHWDALAVLRIRAAGRRIGIGRFVSSEGAELAGRHLMAIAQRARLRTDRAPG